MTPEETRATLEAIRLAYRPRVPWEWIMPLFLGALSALLIERTSHPLAGGFAFGSGLFCGVIVTTRFRRWLRGRA